METEPVDIDRIVKDANRSEIHRQTGISLSGVSRILSGGRNARTGNLSKVAAQLGVTMDELYAYLIRVRNRRVRRRRGVAA